MDPIGIQSERLAALGHPVRLGILRQIVQGPSAGTPAGEIQQSLGIPASTLSHHLSSLSNASLVLVERQGTTLRYRAHFETLRELTAFIWEDCCRREPGWPEADSGCATAFPACACAEPESRSAPARSAPPRPWSPDED